MGSVKGVPAEFFFEGVIRNTRRYFFYTPNEWVGAAFILCPNKVYTSSRRHSLYLDEIEAVNSKYFVPYKRGFYVYGKLVFLWNCRVLEQR